MLFATRYTFTGDRTPDSTKALLAAFAQRGAAEGEIAHYVNADGRGGLLITENDSMQAIYEAILAYHQWIDYEITPILTIEEAMPTIGKVFG